MTRQRQDGAEARRQAAAEAEQAAAAEEWARNLVAAWPPLTEEQRDQLRVLLDLSNG